MDESFTVTTAPAAFDGGDGTDTLDFGDFRAMSTVIWNRAESSGGSYDVLDPVTGARSVITFMNIERIVGSPHDDFLQGNSQITSIFGGAGNDTIQVEDDNPNPSFLRGGEGDDLILGGDTFDNINGNQGNDVLHGFEDNDWVSGGKDDDLIFGDDGDDILNGNLGNDTAEGGDGNDVVRGGQGDDSLFGGAGDDWISGDRGNDSLTGGSGADIFHAGAGIDRVLDFNAGDGDRVQVDAGAHYTVSQVDADTVIDLGDGDQMILVGVQAEALPSDWIFSL